jgi:2-polyprenyl-3-methyl-5-hydroxy-6-metoxy-1,4-benzoquinol methylase
VNVAASSLLQILDHVERELARGATRLELEVLDPDRGRGLYAGEVVAIDGVSYVHRPFRVWVDLAERLGLRLLTPRAIDDRFVRLVFERLARTRDSAALGDREAVATERYGTDSEFARITKLEDPGFVLDMSDALARVALRADARVLDLGVNTGDELALLRARVPALRDARLVGIDHSASAIAKARERFAGDNVELHVADVNELGVLELGRFDLVLSIGTLQSPGVDDRELVRRIVQDHLAPDGAVILGFPNSRYVDGEVEHGTRMKNYRQPELGLLVKDVAFYRKYLQQHHRRVFVTGKHYILVTGVTGRGEG